MTPDGDEIIVKRQIRHQISLPESSPYGHIHMLEMEKLYPLSRKYTNQTP